MAPWPLPQQYQQGSSVLWLSPDVKYLYSSAQVAPAEFEKYWEGQKIQTSGPDPAAGYPQTKLPISPDTAEKIVQSAFKRMKADVFSDRFVPEIFHPIDTEFEPKLEASKVYIQQIVIEEQRVESHHTVSNEAYSLDISNEGEAVIKATSSHGALRALQTLSQLFYAHSDVEGDVYTPYAPVSIKDSPYFEHRGLNLDISRNRISPADVMRTLDAMGFNKFNRLHLHASDAQSWPLEIPALPDLARKGAYHKSQIWSVANLKEVLEHGASWGIQVYIEIDMPGHTASIYHSYPDLITAYDQRPWKPYACEPPSGQLQLNSDKVTSFLSTLFDDLLPRVSPYSTYFHVGGDEINSNAYALDPTVNSSSKDVIRPYLQSFFERAMGNAISHSLSPVVWEEPLVRWDLDLPKSAIIQSWRSQASLAAIVAKGHRALFGPCTHWYLDCGFGDWMDPDPSKADSSVKPPYLDWCSPYKNWKQVYSYDPLEGVPDEHKYLVIGGEVHLWGELTDSVNLDGMLWPRAAAAAEILWRGKSTLSEDTTRRLAEMRERLLRRGIRAFMVQMEWSLRNPGGSLM
ncbi:N-acetyl-glucosamine-6-phosphate deacetylase [Arachnomyces sp. PD_36]|nr:N-acetyl-glucosamine-6-phosphate deacetylase [Arachnomyces sp. PD_36]